MAAKVCCSVSMSLDGYIAPESVPVEDLFAPEKQDDPDVQRWMAQWMELQQWVFPQRFFRENLKLGAGGEEGRDNDIVRETFERTGASVIGKRMFDAGAQAWPEEAPVPPPCFGGAHAERGPRSGRRRPRRSSACRTRSVPPGSGRAGPPSTSSTTASSPRSTRPARPPASATSASRAAARGSWRT